MTTEDWDEVPVHKCKSKVKSKTNNNNINNKSMERVQQSIDPN